MKSGMLLIVVGVVLIVAAWVTAARIPEAANRDFDQLVRSHGGSMSHTQNFPDAYKKMSANRRMLQNAYIGGAGLICLAVGLASTNSRKEEGVEPAAAP